MKTISTTISIRFSLHPLMKDIPALISDRLVLHRIYEDHFDPNFNPFLSFIQLMKDISTTISTRFSLHPLMKDIPALISVRLALHRIYEGHFDLNFNPICPSSSFRRTFRPRFRFVLPFITPWSKTKRNHENRPRGPTAPSPLQFR